MKNTNNSTVIPNHISVSQHCLNNVQRYSITDHEAFTLNVKVQCYILVCP